MLLFHHKEEDVSEQHMRIILFILAISLSACDLIPSSSDVTGKWKSEGESEIMIFHKNNSFELIDANGKSMIDKSSGAKATWQAITEVTPHQLYVKIETDKKSKKIPLGIYKVSNGKLILRPPKTFHNTIGGMSLGISRYEMPTDFNGVLNVYTKM